MTSFQNSVTSLELMFLSNDNIRDLSAFIGRDVTSEMKNWAAKKNLDDYESVQMDYTEALDFINKEFAVEHKGREYEENMTNGQKYPKYYIENNLDSEDVQSYRSFDAQYYQEVMRSNKNFRHGNAIKKRETGLYTRNYDRNEHENGLRDTRELTTLDRGYDMKDIYGTNPYESSDSIMYSYNEY